MQPIEASRLERHLRVLTEEIGVRLAGGDGERRAAAYIADRFRQAGVQVHEETFPCRERAVTEQRLEVCTGGQWRAFPCSLFAGADGTDGQTVEAPLVFFASQTEYARPDLAYLRGKAVVHLGCHIESREHYRRLMEAAPAFLLFVDTRYPGATPLADGLFPAYVQALGARPVVNVAYLDAWNWLQDGAAAARLRVRGGMRPSASQNVIADLPGSEPGAPILFAGAHHDTQADSVGADDNGTGVAGVLELARVLAPLPRRRPIRLISFGGEEQLSVGSAAYVRAHRRDLTAAGGLIFNLDGFGSLMGWSQLACNGPAGLRAFFQPFFERADQWLRYDTALTPYGDHFPFVAAGLAGVCLGRNNCAAGRFFHHRPDDDLTRVSCPRMAATLDAVAHSLAALAAADPLPFPPRFAVAPAVQAEADTMWRDLFGGWEEAG